MIDKWDKVDLILTKNEDSYFEDTKVLFDDLEKQIQIFESEKNNSHEFSELRKIKSPITILDGKWGSGKTYFLEHFLENFEKFKTDKNEKDYIIDDYKYIDALDLIDDEDIVLDFMIHLISDNKFIDGVKTFGKEFMRFSRNSMADVANYIPGINIDKKDKGESLSSKEKIDLINKFANSKSDKLDGKRVLIIIDNIERIGNDSKKIMKLLYRLRQVGGFVFLVVANITKLVEFENDNDEYPIYKFINLRPYNLVQNYISALESFIGDKNIDEKELDIINNALNKNKGKRLVSLRELTSWIKSSEYFQNDSLMKRLKMFNEFNLKWNEIEINDEFSKIYKEQITKIINDLKSMYLELNEIEIGNKVAIVDVSDSSYGVYNGFVYNKIDKSLYEKDGSKIPTVTSLANDVSSPNSRWNYKGKNYSLSQLSEVILRESENNFDLPFEELNSFIHKLEIGEIDEKCFKNIYDIATNKNQNITNSGHFFEVLKNNEAFIKDIITKIETCRDELTEKIENYESEINNFKVELDKLINYDYEFNQMSVAKIKIVEIEKQISELSNDNDNDRRTLLLDKEHQKEIVDKFNELTKVDNHIDKIEKLKLKIEETEKIQKEDSDIKGMIVSKKYISILTQVNLYIETFIKLYSEVILQNDKEIIPNQIKSDVDILLDTLEVITSEHIDKYTASII